MTTQAQIEANRRNAQLSTGPVTTQGKAAVRQNAFKHGLRSALYIENWSERDEYDALSTALLAEHQPQTPTEELYVERMLLAHHKLCIVEVTEEKWDFYDEGDPRLAVLRQHQDRLERSFDRALATLRKLQADRKKRQAEAEIPAQEEAREAETKQEAKKLVHEALQLVAVLRKGEAVLKSSANPPVQPIEPVDTDPALPPAA